MSSGPKKRFAAHVLMWNCGQFILRMIDNCGPYVEKIYVAYSEVPWNYNPEAKRFKNNTPKDILKKSKYFGKIELIEGAWEKDEDTRNACLNRAIEDGFDYLIIQDADEFYREADYKKNIDEIIKNPDYDVYITPWIIFWKNLNYVIENKNNSIIDGYPEFAVNCHSNTKFIRARIPNSNKIYKLSGLCFHLSYVLTSEQVYSKINTWGHAHQFNRDKWYKNKWLKWNHSTYYLHPVEPDEWKRAIAFKDGLPEVLSNFESPGVVPYKDTFFDSLFKILNIDHITGKIMKRSYDIYSLFTSKFSYFINRFKAIYSH